MVWNVCIEDRKDVVDSCEIEHCGVSTEGVRFLLIRRDKDSTRREVFPDSVK